MVTVILLILTQLLVVSGWITLPKKSLYLPADSSVYDYPFVILPGFGNNQQDYLNPLGMGSEKSIKSSLQSRGIKNVEVVEIERTDWLKIALGLGSLEFWQSKCTPNKLFEFYFDAVDKTVRNAVDKYGKPVVLVGHSAGGWLVRGLIADGNWKSQETKRTSELVVGLVTLGTPHLPPAVDAPDMTRGAVRYVDENFPGAFLSDLFYVSVCGTAVFGNSSAEKGTPQYFAADSYSQVTGSKNKGEEIGDGVVPLSSAHLNGAQQITLDGVWHSIQAPKNYWYGGDGVIDKWLPQTLQQLNMRITNKRTKITGMSRESVLATLLTAINLVSFKR